MTHDELVELQRKIQQLTKGMEDRIVFDAKTGRATMLVEPGKTDRAFDLEKALPRFPRQPGVTDDQIEDMVALTNEINSALRRYIDEYGVFPPELYTH